MTKTTIIITDSSGEISPEPASAYFDDEIALPVLAPSPLPATDQAALGEILADALFGEVIEISDLIPHLLAPAADVAVGSAPVDVVMADEMAGDTMAAMVPFTILFEEDGSSGHGTF
ncbi:hypothetical protein WHT83_05280 [Aminobacter sp. P9b]|uniref:hypothetical protein n=1 Tax=Aminobacter sp. P9b TaxID=3133697 RepID=UPI0032525193